MMPWTELVTNTSLARSSRGVLNGSSFTGMPSCAASRSTAARVIPGSSRPSAGGVTQDAVDHREDVGPVGLQHLPVRVQDQEMLVRAEAGLLAGRVEQAAVPPLVRAEPAGDGDRAQADGLRRRAGRDDLGGDLAAGRRPGGR